LSGSKLAFRTNTSVFIPKAFDLGEIITPRLGLASDPVLKKHQTWLLYRTSQVCLYSACKHYTKRRRISALT
jgi:hypothetical protein